jgi:hypothetical protein
MCTLWQYRGKRWGWFERKEIDVVGVWGVLGAQDRAASLCVSRDTGCCMYCHFTVPGTQSLTWHVWTFHSGCRSEPMLLCVVEYC